MIFRKSKKQESNESIVETPKTDVDWPQAPKETFQMFSSYIKPIEQMLSMQSEAMISFPTMVNNAIFGQQHQLPLPQSKSNLHAAIYEKISA